MQCFPTTEVRAFILEVPMYVCKMTSAKGCDYYLLYAIIKIHKDLLHVSNSDSGFVERTLGHGDAEALEVLQGVWSSLANLNNGGQRPTSWKDCVSWARCKWETLYNNDIRQLLHCFPPDQVKSQKLTWHVCSFNSCLWTRSGAIVYIRV